MRSIALIALLALAGCQRCGDPPTRPGPRSPADTGGGTDDATRAEATALLPALTSVAWSRDGELIAVGGTDETVVLDAATLTEVRRIGDGRGGHHASFVAGDRLAIQGSADTVPAHWRATLWDPRTGVRVQEATTPLACATDAEVAWGCDRAGQGFRGRYTRADETLTIERWDGASLRPAWTITDRPPISSVVVAIGAGGTAVLAGAGGYSRTEVEPTIAHTSEQTPDGERRVYFEEERPKLVSGGFVHVFHGGRFRCEALGVGDAIVTAAVAADGRILTGDRRGALHLLDPDCAEVRAIDGPGHEAIAVAFASDDRAASIHADGTLRLWDLSTGEAIRSLPVAAPDGGSAEMP